MSLAAITVKAMIMDLKAINYVITQLVLIIAAVDYFLSKNTHNLFSCFSLVIITTCFPLFNSS